MKNIRKAWFPHYVYGGVLLLCLGSWPKVLQEEYERWRNLPQKFGDVVEPSSFVFSGVMLRFVISFKSTIRAICTQSIM